MSKNLLLKISSWVVNIVQLCNRDTEKCSFSVWFTPNRFVLTAFIMPLFILFVVLLPEEVKAHKTANDSLYALLESLPASKQRVDVINQLVDNGIVYGQPKEARRLSEEAVALAKKLGYQKGYALALNRLGTAYWAEGKMLKAFNYYNDSRKVNEGLNDNYLLARNLNSIGNIYAVLGNIPAARSYYYEALPLYYELNQPNRIAAVYSNLGKILLDANQLDSAHYYLNKALPLAKEHY